VVFLSGSESVQVFSVCLYMYCRWRSSVYICIAVGDPVIKREGETSLTGLTMPYFMHIPSQYLDFQCHMWWFVFRFQWVLVKIRGDCSYCWWK